jgi:hypothetical protein
MGILDTDMARSKPANLGPSIPYGHPSWRQSWFSEPLPVQNFSSMILHEGGAHHVPASRRAYTPADDRHSTSSIKDELVQLLGEEDKWDNIAPTKKQTDRKRTDIQDRISSKLPVEEVVHTIHTTLRIFMQPGLILFLTLNFCEIMCVQVIPHPELPSNLC